MDNETLELLTKTADLIEMLDKRIDLVKVKVQHLEDRIDDLELRRGDPK